MNLAIRGESYTVTCWHQALGPCMRLWPQMSQHDCSGGYFTTINHFSVLAYDIAGLILGLCQWETALLCNDVCHWQGASLEWALILYCVITRLHIYITLFVQVYQVSVSLCRCACIFRALLETGYWRIQFTNLKCKYWGDLMYSFIAVSLNKLLNKGWSCQQFEMLRNGIVM